MMRRVSLVWVVITTVLALAQVPQPKPLSPFEQELISNQKQFMQAWQEKNVVFAGQMVSDDFKGVAKNGDLYDKNELVGDVHEGLPKDFRTYDFEVVRLDESCAIVTYNEIVPGAQPRYRHISDTWTKDGGKWKLKFRQLTPNLWSAVDLD
jgi:hypothetical protein